MKKYYIRLLLIALVLQVSNIGEVRAQRPVGDTLPCPTMDSSYFLYIYDWCLMMEDTTLKASLYDRLVPYGVPNPAEQCTYASDYFEGNYRAGSQMYTSRPIKILGIAACAEREEAYPISGVLNTLDTTLAGRFTDSLILYKATAKGPQWMAAGPWRIEYPHRYVVLPERNEFPSPVSGMPPGFMTLFLRPRCMR